ncbi:type II secretion system protein GspM [Thiohalocapsa marina]|uniref:type II secretion system protein GspM n=1 Tax=Thiohalocapsa marina TaxID=424902 RepID=UPI001FE948D0|nr:type II secretion system protein GspM [Thiohalocapsa marina]
MLVWGVVIALPALLLALVLVPWWQQLSELDTRLSRDADQLARYRALVATLPGLRAELQREQARDDFKAFYVDAATRALAGARVQSEVQDIVRDAGARPISAQVLPGLADEQPPRVRIRLQLQADTEQLLEVLYRIEQVRPFLFVEQMSVRSRVPGHLRATPRGRRQIQSVVEAGDLTVRLDIFGYTLGRGD